MAVLSEDTGSAAMNRPNGLSTGKANVHLHVAWRPSLADIQAPR